MGSLSGPRNKATKTPGRQFSALQFTSLSRVQFLQLSLDILPPPPSVLLLLPANQIDRPQVKPGMFAPRGSGLPLTKGPRFSSVVDSVPSPTAPIPDLRRFFPLPFLPSRISISVFFSHPQMMIFLAVLFLSNPPWTQSPPENKLLQMRRKNSSPCMSCGVLIFDHQT
jgi:hypothetical protein